MNGTSELQADTKIAIINEKSIKDKIFTIRNQLVILDSDLAEIYGYELKAMNQQVKRNIERFPADFMFQLSRDEIDLVKSQIVTSPNSSFFAGQEGGRRKLPYVFTEQGVYMLATVLKGETAVIQSIMLMRIFKQMKDYILSSVPSISNTVIDNLALQASQNAKDIMEIKENMISKADLPDIIRSFGFSAAKCDYLILNGETVEAAVAYRNIYGQAKGSIYIIDNYIDIKTLYLLNDIGSNIECKIFSDNIGNKLRAYDYNSFSAEYNIHVEFFTTQKAVHDRYIVLDYNKDTEQIYHCGASSKDAGNKVTTISKAFDNLIYHPLIDLLNNNPKLTLT